MAQNRKPADGDYFGIPRHIEYPDRTIYALVADMGLAHPDTVAYEFLGKKTTYRRFLQQVDNTARALLTMGITAGDRVTIAMPNSPQAVDMFYALNRIGAVSNMIHPLSAPGEMLFYLNFSKSRAILIYDQFYDKLMEIYEQLDHPVQIITARITDAMDLPLKIGYRLTQGRTDKQVAADSRHITWNEFLAKGRTGSTLPEPAADAGVPAAILYSGGTTGTQKGILLSSRNINATALQTIAASGLESILGLKMLSIMPMFHGFGLGIGIHTALVGGCRCILVPRFNVKTYADLLRKKKPNFIAGVPTLYEALLRTEGLEQTDLSCLLGVFSGGDSLSAELKAKADRFLRAHNANVQIREGYGTTECVTASCLTPAQYHREGSIGIPFPDTQYCIVRVGTDEPVPCGEQGEICISGPSVMIGYLDNEEETLQTLHVHADGKTWLHTGDLGTMDEDGFVYFKQRIKRMIITSGFNVYPSQIENIIDRHEDVLYSCVIGVKDDYKMQRVKAFVVLRPGVEPSEQVKEGILDLCRRHIAKYEMPREIEFRNELPKTLVGKVAYRVLEEEEAQKEAQQ